MLADLTSLCWQLKAAAGEAWHLQLPVVQLLKLQRIHVVLPVAGSCSVASVCGCKVMPTKLSLLLQVSLWALACNLGGCAAGAAQPQAA